VAMLIEVLTDNRNRTGAEIRNVFTKMGGSMAEPGSVSWQFHRRGVVLVDGSVSEDDLLELVLESGADDLVDDGGAWRVTCEPSSVAAVRDTVEARGFPVIAADSPMISDNLVPIDSVDVARSVVRIIEAMEDNDDVQDVYSNFEMSDEVLEEAAS
jgi:YebC/PmpR family DNA-binding regulatory protein